MAVYSFQTSAQNVSYGRSGYNKDGDNDDEMFPSNFGRSGYNKGDGDDDEDSKQLANFGRSGYNKGGSNDEDDKGRSGYN